MSVVLGTAAGASSGASLPTQTGNSGKYLTTDGSAASWGAVAAGGSSVTSVALSVPDAFLAVTGSPVTSTGTLGLIYGSSALAPANGGTGTATAFTSGSIVFVGSSGIHKQDNAKLFWDDTNDRLFVRQNSMTTINGVNGDISMTGGLNLTGRFQITGATAQIAITDRDVATHQWTWYSAGDTLGFNWFPGAGGTDWINLGSSGAVKMAKYGAGAATFDASGNITSASDERLKNIQRPFASGISALAGVEPIVYKWNAISGLDMKSEYVGFSAQNVLASIPEAIGTDHNGFYSLSDRTIMATMVNAIKEMAAEIKDLRAEMLALKG